MLQSVIYKDVTAGELLTAFLIFFAIILINRLFAMFMRRSLRHRWEKDSVETMIKVIRYTVIVVLLIVVLPMIGINLSGLMVAGGITGIVVGFASQRIFSNLISGIFLMIERPVKIGEQVHIEGVEGFVEGITVFSTIIRSYNGLFIRIPNERVFSANITNYVSNVVRRVEYTIGIRYQDDAEKAVSIIKQAVEVHPLALKYPEPLVFVSVLSESSVDIVVRIWAPVSEWFALKKEMLWILKSELERNGIQIPFPQRVVHMVHPESPES